MTTTRYTTSHAFTSHVATGFTYADGRQTTSSHDALYRRTSLEEGYGPATGSIASWQFFGPSRVAEFTLGNGLICSMMNNARTHSAVQPGVSNPSWGSAASDRLGYDGAGRMIAKRFLAGGINPSGDGYNDTTPVVGFTTAFDRSGNKLFERELHAENRSHLYQPMINSDGTYPSGTSGGGGSGVDSVNRLLQYQRGTLAPGSPGGTGGGSVTTPISLPGTDQNRGYELDGLGNWQESTYTPVDGDETTDLRQHNKLNQIVSRKVGADPKVTFGYDHGNNAADSNPLIQLRGNGNLTDDGVRLYAYDALNRLVQVKRQSDGAVIGSYVYDASPGRRISKTVSNGGLSGDIPDGTTQYLYAPGTWQCVEERDATSPGDPTKQYAWGIYIDELLQQKTYVNTGSQPLSPGSYYPLQDLLYRTTALTDDAGDIVEAYDTDAYGNTLIFSAAGTGGNWWADDAEQTDYPSCEVIFCGYRYEAEIANYLVRVRILIPALSRWLQRHPPTNSARRNLYLYNQNRPTSRLDPTGYGSVSPQGLDWIPQCLDDVTTTLACPEACDPDSYDDRGTAPCSYTMSACFEVKWDKSEARNLVIKFNHWPGGTATKETLKTCKCASGIEAETKPGEGYILVDQSKITKDNAANAPPPWDSKGFPIEMKYNGTFLQFWLKAELEIVCACGDPYTPQWAHKSWPIKVEWHYFEHFND